MHGFKFHHNIDPVELFFAIENLEEIMMDVVANYYQDIDDKIISPGNRTALASVNHTLNHFLDTYISLKKAFDAIFKPEDTPLEAKDFLDMATGISILDKNQR